MRSRRPMVLMLSLFLALIGSVGLAGAGTETSREEMVSQAGWNSSKLDAAFGLARNYGTGTLIVMTSGRTIRSMGDVCTPHRVHSVRKALLSALVGQHVGTGPGRIDLNATLAQLGIDDHPEPLTRLQKQATVLHLIKSVSGIDHAAAGEIPSMTADKRRRLGETPNVPGTVWAYNNWDYNALTTIFEQSTGLSVAEAFMHGIAKPLGMQDFTPSCVTYSKNEALSRHAKAGFRMSARDLAKFGQLYLNGGLWNGKRLLSREWIARITSDFTPTGKMGVRSGHGYLWWVPCDPWSKKANIPGGTFIATGLGGQRVVVIPSWETVIVHTVFTDDYFGFCAEWAKNRGMNLEQAATYSRTRCRKPEYAETPFCRRCRYYSDSDFETLLSKIITARMPP